MRRLATITLATLLAGCGPDPEFDKIQAARDQQAAQETAQQTAEEAARKERAAADVKWNAELQEYQQHLAAKNASLRQCATDYVGRYRKSSLSASELIEAALSSCRAIVQAIREDSTAFTSTHFPPDDRRNLDERTVDQAVQSARGLCFQVLAEK